MNNEYEKKQNDAINQIISRFSKSTGLHDVKYEVLERIDGSIIVIKIANPTERFYTALEDAVNETQQELLFKINATIKKIKPKKILESPESKLLIKVISESLTVNRYSFKEDFFNRYIKSIIGAEEQILAQGNHIIFGRRGSGKSSLLLYALRNRQLEKLPTAWVEMQTYAGRNDYGVAIDVFKEVLLQLKEYTPDSASLEEELSRIDRIAKNTETEINKEMLEREIPEIRRVLGSISSIYGSTGILLDDFHVIDLEFQPALLSALYSSTRGNRVHLKITAIETLTKLYNPATKEGLDTPNDGQELKLDYNLTQPKQAMEHIKSILNSHAIYSGLNGIRSLYADNAFMNRLVWVSAGVPRDALNILSKALIKSIPQGRKYVTIMAINEATSEIADSKIRDLELDSSGELEESLNCLNLLKDFCIKTTRNNAFLVEKKNDDPIFENIKKLVDLRLLHIINEGISIREAGKKFMALILDYGFYVGLRASKRISLFNESINTSKYSDLRKLPVFKG